MMELGLFHISVGIIALVIQLAIDPDIPWKSKFPWGWTRRQYKTKLIVGGVGMIFLGLLLIFLSWDQSF